MHSFAVVTMRRGAATVKEVDMKKGDRGDTVVALQQLLLGLGFSPGEPDGVFGRLTEEAVKRFQRANELDATGVADERTLEAANESVGRAPPPVAPSADALSELIERVPVALRGALFSAQQRVLADYVERARKEPDVSFRERVARTAEFFLEVGVREVAGQNRGPWVDFIRGIGGGPFDKANDWCASFVSACLQIAKWVRNSDEPIHKSESATQLWLGAPESTRVVHTEVPATKPRGSVFVRARSSAVPQIRDAVLQGTRTKGHTGIVVDRLDDGTLLCISGNSSGEGHSRQSGSGSVAMEQIGPATEAARKAMDRLVGLIDYDRV